MTPNFYSDWPKRFRAVLVVLLWLLVACLSHAQSDVAVGCWNLESGQAEVATLANRLKTYPSCHVWGFSEVQNQSWLDELENALGGTYRSKLGTSGGADKLAVAYDSSVLELTGLKELHHLNPGRVRSPMVCQFRDKRSGTRFTVIVNHFARGKAWKRHKLAASLNAWVKKRAGATIAIGDYNFDWDIPTSEVGDGYALLTKGNTLRWVRPKKLIRTEDSRANVQDFVFVSPEIVGRSTILFRADDFEPKKKASDHRPVRAELRLP